MSNYEFNSLEDFIKFCNNSYSSSKDKCNNCKYGNKNATADENTRCADSDIPGGFQDMDPQLLIIGTSLLGAILSEKMPFNVQNIVGNWLELLGQVILTFNAQQQYFQNGPGVIYDPVYRNVSNPFCEDTTDESSPSSQNNNSNSNSSFTQKDLSNLETTINELHNEINQLKHEIYKLRNS